MAEKFVIEYCKECDGKNDEICTQFIPVNHNNICHRCGHKKDSHTTFESEYMICTQFMPSNDNPNICMRCTHPIWLHHSSNYNKRHNVKPSSNSLHFYVMIPPNDKPEKIPIDARYSKIHKDILQTLKEDNIISTTHNDITITVNKDIIPNILLFKKIYTTIGEEILRTLLKNGGRLPYKSRTKRRTQRRHKKQTKRRHKKN